MMNMLLNAMSTIKPVFEGQMVGLDALKLETREIQGLRGTGTADLSVAESDASFARYHSMLAMEAARKMRRTRQKRKTGQEVCHHLKMMLAEPAPERESRAESQFQLGF